MRQQLEECLTLYRMESPRPRIGKILVDKGYLQQEDLVDAIKEQIKDILFEVLSWKQGLFPLQSKKLPMLKPSSLRSESTT